MTAYPIPNPFANFVGATGLPLTGAKIYIGVAGDDPETNPIAVYQDAGLTIPLAQPIRTNGGYIVGTGTPANAYPSVTPYSMRVTTSAGVLVFYQAVVHDQIADFLALIQGANGAASVGFTPTGTGAQTSTVAAFLDRNIVDLTSFYNSATDAGDYTQALSRAVAKLGTNGGVIEVPAGQYAMNGVIAHDNITLRGKGGRGEFNAVCLTPFSLASPTLTFGNDTTVYRYCGIENLHISGTTYGADSSKVANQAPSALMFKGGTVNFTSRDCVLYSGVKTLNMTPASAASQPISAINFFGGAIRNDITDSSTARAIYGIRKASDLAYLTAIQFWGVHIVNQAGYAAEVDGTAFGWTFSINGCYFDTKPDHGILLKGGAGVVSWNSQLDPGALGAVVIETDQAPTDISRFVAGSLFMQLQKIKFNDTSTLTVPDNMSLFSDTAHLYRPMMGPNGYIFSPVHPLDVAYAAQYNFDGTTVNWQGGYSHAFDSSVKATGYRVGANQVVGARQAAITAPTLAAPNANETALLTYATAIRDAMRTHGLLS